MSVERLVHSKVELALHELRSGPGRSLLLLHGLGGHTPARVPDELAAWPGPVHGLDFTCHGESSIPRSRIAVAARSISALAIPWPR